MGQGDGTRGRFSCPTFNRNDRPKPWADRGERGTEEPSLCPTEKKRRTTLEVINVTLVQEAMSIMEAMPRRNQQIVLELLRAMSSQPTFREKPEKKCE